MASPEKLAPISDGSAVVTPGGFISIYWRGWLNALMAVVNRLSSGHQTGRGAPGGVVYGYVGDLYTDQTGGAGSTLFVKEAGNGTTAGWVAK